MAAAGGGFTSADQAPWWQPPVQASWQIQFTETLDLTVNADIFDLDMFDNTPDTVAALHAAGRKAICYMDAGTFEDWRPDAAAFPDALKGNANGWPGERWLDIRRIDLLGPILEARMDLCRAKGFDAIDPDNVDGYANKTGFPLTYDDQLRFNTYLATAAHARGLAVGLKNDLDQVPDLVNAFDFAVNEQCFQYRECSSLLPFLQAGKPVFEIEYKLAPERFCANANTLNLNSLKKETKLNAARIACR
jgi:hypothetical protein